MRARFARCLFFVLRRSFAPIDAPESGEKLVFLTLSGLGNTLAWVCRSRPVAALAVRGEFRTGARFLSCVRIATRRSLDDGKGHRAAVAKVAEAERKDRICLDRSLCVIRLRKSGACKYACGGTHTLRVDVRSAEKYARNGRHEAGNEGLE